MGPTITTGTQLSQIAWTGGVFIVNYATMDILVLETKSRVSRPRFFSEYDELMWLAEKQKGSLGEEETLRFYELREHWPEMHSDSHTCSFG